MFPSLEIKVTTQELSGQDYIQEDPQVRTCQGQVNPKRVKKTNYTFPMHMHMQKITSVQRLCVYLPIEDKVKYAPGVQDLSQDLHLKAGGQEASEGPSSSESRNAINASAQAETSPDQGSVSL